MRPARWLLHSLLAVLLLFGLLGAMADDYTVSPGNKSLMVAGGCFWCVEQAFEQYAPGVIEAISGYAGGTNDNPTYRNHPGHYEVVLVEYNPAKTSYGVLLRYAWRNIDPFNGNGQFCDKGSSYRPAIFYATEEERVEAENVLTEILEENPDWDPDSIAVPILERPKFWTAEDYHQDYYIKKPKNYGFYKERCGRTQRLKDVWGEETYYCYHDLAFSCFLNVTNSDGVAVEAEVNVKGVAEAQPSPLPTFAIIIIAFLSAGIFCLMMVLLKFYCDKKNRTRKDAERHFG